MNLISSGLVNEKMEPQSILVSQNGDISIKAKGSYYRYSFFRMFIDDHFGWMVESIADGHKSGYDAYKEYPVWSHKPNIRYLLLDPSFIESQISQSPATNGIHSIKHISISGTNYIEFLGATLNGKVKTKYEAEVIPKRLRAQCPKSDQLPITIRSGKEYRLSESVIYQNGRNAVSIRFDQLSIGSSRQSCTWWGYPIITTFYYAPVTILAVPYKLIDILIDLPFNIIRHANYSTKTS